MSDSSCLSAIELTTIFAEERSGGLWLEKFEPLLLKRDFAQMTRTMSAEVMVVAHGWSVMVMMMEFVSMVSSVLQVDWGRSLCESADMVDSALKVDWVAMMMLARRLNTMAVML